jgi:hypothetical protein
MTFLSTYSNFSGSIKTEVSHQQEWFMHSFNDCIAWAMQRAKLFEYFMAGKGKCNNCHKGQLKILLKDLKGN